MMDKCYASGLCADYWTTYICVWGDKVISNPLVLFMVTEEWLRLESQPCLLASGKPQTDDVLSLTSTAKTAPPPVFI